MVPGKVYEILPYAYIAAGVTVPLLLKSWLGLFSGVLLMVLGAVVWVMRSDNRRSDGFRNHNHGSMPFWLYECLPFSYGIAAVLIFMLSENIYLFPSAAILLVVGLQLWFMRGLYRKHIKPDTGIRHQALRW